MFEKHPTTNQQTKTTAHKQKKQKKTKKLFTAPQIQKDKSNPLKTAPNATHFQVYLNHILHHII